MTGTVSKVAPVARVDGKATEPAKQLFVRYGFPGNQAMLRMQPSAAARGFLGNQAMLRIGAVDDPLEREADRVADAIMRMPEPAASERPLNKVPAVAAGGHQKLRRVCAECEEEEKQSVVRPKLAGPAPAPADAVSPPAVHEALATSGQPLGAPTRIIAENSIGFDLSQVRVHNDAASDRAARSVGARAFTVGRDIVFARGEYAPASSGGRRLLMHELAHVAQQQRAALMLQRACTHDFTPVNCHNWTLPLPPWLAGIIAHQQIAAWTGILSHGIPRASKTRLGMPSTPTTPWGFADLWQNAAAVSIGEIKSTAVGSGVAGAEAAHYVWRHDESIARGPLAPDDMVYLADVGGLKPGALLNLSGLTGTGIAVGPFAGDPMKTLWAEADSLGAVVYWCTGVGAVNPLWLKLFKDATDALKKKLQDLKRMMEGVIDDIIAGGRAVARFISDVIGDIVSWGQAHSRALALAALILILLVAVVLLIFSILTEPVSAGTSTVGVFAALAGLVGSATGILALIGLSSPGLPAAAATTASALNPQAADARVGQFDYDPPGDRQPVSLQAALAARPADPGTQLVAALQPLLDPQAMAIAAVRAFRGGINDAAGLSALRNGIRALRTAGDEASASAIERQMVATSLA